MNFPQKNGCESECEGMANFYRMCTICGEDDDEEVEQEEDALELLPFVLAKRSSTAIKDEPRRHNFSFQFQAENPHVEHHRPKMPCAPLSIL